VPVKITNVPKTIADCFKYRHKMGLDVAMEALQETWNANAFRWMNFGNTV
jgi:predicted transcriptional regulator of viral defense system